MARSRKNRTIDYAEPDTTSAPSVREPNRRVLLIISALITLGVIFGYAGGGAWAIVLYHLLLDGALLVAWLLAAAGFGSIVLGVLPLRDRNSPEDEDRESVLYVVTAIALGLGIFGLLTLALGLAGWLNRASSFAMLGVGGALGIFHVARGGLRNREAAGDAIRDWLNAPAMWSWLWLLAMPFLGMAIVVALVPPGLMWPGEPHGYDVVEYHLQIPREWYEIGRIVPLHHNAFSFFPFNVEMHYLLAMHLHGGPWAGMYLAHFMHLAMIVLCIATVYGFAKRLALSAGAATIASVAVATTPWMTQLSSIAYNEGGLLLFGTLAMGWAFRATISPVRRLGRFPIAGLLAGFACGCKLTAVPEILVAVGGLCASAIVATRKSSDVPFRSRIAGVAMFFLAGMLAFSPWLVRNIAWTGNPVFPEATAVFGKAHFSDSQADRWKQAHAPRPDQRASGAGVRAWWSEVWINPQYGYALLPLGLLCGTVGLSRQERTAKIAILLQVGMFIALSTVWLCFTHLQGRFFILGVPIAGLLVASLPARRWMIVTTACVVAASAILGFAGLHQTVAERLVERKLNLAMGIENLSDVLPPAIAETLNTDKPIALIGDARGFLYTIPMSRLSYRTVFDVDAQPGESVIDAWARGVPADAIRTVDPVELRRFSETYQAIPPLPAEFSDRAEPFVITSP